jgi:hypothetical protein
MGAVTGSARSFIGLQIGDLMGIYPNTLITARLSISEIRGQDRTGRHGLDGFPFLLLPYIIKIIGHVLRFRLTRRRPVC